MRWLFAFGATGIAVLLLELIAQIVLPGLAASHIRDELQKTGRVLDVEVAAFPAVKLLVHEADSVTVRMATYSATTAQLKHRLEEASDTATLHASARLFKDGLLTTRDASLTKRGSTLIGSATINNADLQAASGGLVQNIVPVSSPSGQLVLQGTIAGLARADVTLEAMNGRLLMVPDVPLGGFLTVTLFSDAHVSITDVSGRRTADGFSIRVTGHLQ
jgi:hypothetical protein